MYYIFNIDTCSNSRKTANMMGTIMAVAAVFDTHMDMKVVTTHRPPSSLAWLQPTVFMTPRAILRCRLLCSIAMARIRPPMNTIMVSFM